MKQLKRIGQVGKHVPIYSSGHCRPFTGNNNEDCPALSWVVQNLLRCFHLRWCTTSSMVFQRYSNWYPCWTDATTWENGNPRFWHLLLRGPEVGLFTSPAFPTAMFQLWGPTFLPLRSLGAYFAWASTSPNKRLEQWCTPSASLWPMGR